MFSNNHVLQPYPLHKTYLIFQSDALQTLIILIFGEVLPKIWIVAPHISVSISLMDNSPKYLGSWVCYPKETDTIHI